MLHGYRMLDDWDALVLIDELYEVQSIILMDNVYTPPILDVFRLLRSENPSMSMNFCP
jgi:hypothetical protein